VTVSDLGEHALLARLLARLPRPGAHILVGPGDDAAVIEPGRRTRLVVTTDALVEHVHVSRRWCSDADIGHKALAVNLSDLAAMGAVPRWATVSLALPADFEVAAAEGLMDGLAAEARRYGVSIAGGNITRSPGPLVVDVTAGGEVSARKWLTRGGGRPGDDVWVSGTVGGARAGLEMLTQGADGASGDEAGRAACLARYRRPEARVRLGVGLARGRAARAAMDASDGLADAVRQLARASGCGARILAEAIPIEPGARAWWLGRGVDPVLAALGGGEDYELVFTVPPRWRGRLRQVQRHVTDPGLTRVGTLTRAAEIVLERDGRLEPWPEGYEHFRPTGA
jgi:thiamine-monophosphate kinase